MFPRNFLTAQRADARYVNSVFTRLDCFDNTTDVVDLGSTATCRAFIVEYVLELPVSHRTHIGQLRIVHDGVTAIISEHEYSFPDGQFEIETLAWTAGIADGMVQLVLQKIGVGENPTLHYRVHPVAIA